MIRILLAAMIGLHLDRLDGAPAILGALTLAAVLFISGCRGMERAIDREAELWQRNRKR